VLGNEHISDEELTKHFETDIVINWVDKMFRVRYIPSLRDLALRKVPLSCVWPYLNDCLSLGNEIWSQEWLAM
jgi:hypothetical protein